MARRTRAEGANRYDPLRLAVDALAVYRLTKLATADVIMQPVRDRLIEAAYASAVIPDSSAGFTEAPAASSD